MEITAFSSKDIVDGIRDVAKEIVKLIPKLQKARRDKRMNISKLMYEISDTLVEISAEIRIGNLPHGKCGEIVGFADDLKGRFTSIIGRRRAKKLSEQLHSSYEVEQMAMRLKRVKNKERYLATLEEAGGKFRAVGRILRV